MVLIAANNKIQFLWPIRLPLVTNKIFKFCSELLNLQPDYCVLFIFQTSDNRTSYVC